MRDFVGVLGFELHFIDNVMFNKKNFWALLGFESKINVFSVNSQYLRIKYN